MNAAREAITTKRRNVGAVGAKANTQRFHGRFSFFYKRKVSCARPCVGVVCSLYTLRCRSTCVECVLGFPFSVQESTSWGIEPVYLEHVRTSIRVITMV